MREMNNGKPTKKLRSGYRFRKKKGRLSTPMGNKSLDRVTKLARGDCGSYCFEVGGNFTTIHACRLTVASKLTVNLLHLELGHRMHAWGLTKPLFLSWWKIYYKAWSGSPNARMEIDKASASKVMEISLEVLDSVIDAWGGREAFDISLD